MKKHELAEQIKAHSDKHNFEPKYVLMDRDEFKKIMIKMGYEEHEIKLLPEDVIPFMGHKIVFKENYCIM